MQIARKVKGGNYNVTPVTGSDTTLDKQYWNHKYRLEAVTQLEEMIESSMKKSTFRRITAPSLTLYYYKNEEEQDPTVKVSAMEKMNRQLDTPDGMKLIIPVPNAGGHVLGSYVVSKDLRTVANEISNFAIGKLGMVPAANMEK